MPVLDVPLEETPREVLITCQTPPKVAMPSPCALPLALSMENVYSGWPLSVTWLILPRCQTPSLPLIAGALLGFLPEADGHRGPEAEAAV